MAGHGVAPSSRVARGLGSPRLERLQRGAPVLARLPGARAGLRGTARHWPRWIAPAGAGGRHRARAGRVALRLSPPRPRASVAGAVDLDPADRAVARASPARR